MSISSESTAINHHNGQENHCHDTVNGMVDHTGLPAKRSQSGYWRSARYIIGVGAAERFAFYGISVNLITYLTGPLGQSTAAAAASINIWSGTGLLIPLMGAFVADSWLGRYRTIVLSSLLYILALGLITASAFLNRHHEDHPPLARCPTSMLHILLFYAPLYLMALAQGAFKPCLMSFGADQFDEGDPVELRSRSSFFNWWYFGLSGGPLLALLVLNYIQDNISWVVGFGIPCVAMVIALVILLMGTKGYRYITKVDAKLVTEAYEEDAVPHLNYHEFENNLNEPLLMPNPSTDNTEEEKGARSLVKLLPLWATSLSFTMVVAQNSTLFIKQGATMDRTIASKISIPAASLQYTVGLTVMLFIPMYDRLLVPTARLITNQPSGMTKFQRIGTGMFLLTLCMILAALVETKRLEASLSFEPPMSFVWIVPQYVLEGIACVFTMIGLQEVFYDHVPCGLKSVGLALYLSIIGVGSFLSSFVVFVIQKSTCGEGGGGGWFSDNMSEAHLDYFYWMLAGLNGLSFLGFLCFVRSFGSESTRDEDDHSVDVVA